MRDSNYLIGLAIFAGALALCGFLTSLLHVDAGVIAQSLANILGGAFGAIAAVAVALWTLKRAEAEKQQEAQYYKDLLISDLSAATSHIFFVFAHLSHTPTPDGRLNGSFFGSLPSLDLERLTDPTFPLSLLDVQTRLRVEYLSKVVQRYVTSLDNARASLGPVPVDNQRELWARLDHLRVHLAATLTILGADAVFAAQLESFVVADYVPQIGVSYDGRLARELMMQYNEIARKVHATTQPT